MIEISLVLKRRFARAQILLFKWILSFFFFFLLSLLLIHIFSHKLHFLSLSLFFSSLFNLPLHSFSHFHCSFPLSFLHRSLTHNYKLRHTKESIHVSRAFIGSDINISIISYYFRHCTYLPETWSMKQHASSLSFRLFLTSYDRRTYTLLRPSYATYI